MKRLSALYKRIAILTLAIIIFIIFGTVGFMHSEGLNLLDAIWYSVMTLTTVGFQVPNNFSNEGKIITIFLMLFGVGAVLYGLTALALEIFSGNIGKEYKINIIKKRMKNLENHIIICGFGRNGRQAARKLILHKKPFVIIDKKPLENRDDEFADTIFIHGNAIEDEVLKQAGIEKAVGIIASLPSDADNLFIVISSKELNPNIKVISRASNSNTIKKLKTAGAENVIMPDKIGGDHIASLIVAPDLIEFLDNLSSFHAGKMNIQEIIISPQHKLNKIGDLMILEKTGCTVIGYKSTSGEYIINPGNEYTVQPQGRIIVLGNNDQINLLNNMFGLK